MVENNITYVLCEEITKISNDKDDVTVTDFDITNALDSQKNSTPLISGYALCTMESIRNFYVQCPPRSRNYKTGLKILFKIISFRTNAFFDEILVDKDKRKRAPRGQQSERCLATTSHNDYEVNWNRQTDRHTDRLTHRQTHIELGKGSKRALKV